MQTGFIVVAHKPLASSFLSVAQGIMGKIEGCVAVDVDSDASDEEKFRGLEDAWNSLEAENKLVLLDVEGATPCNALKKFYEDKSFFLVSPLSLPLLLKLLCYRNLDMPSLLEKAKEIKVSFSLETKK